VGWSTVVRNAALFAVTVVIAGRGPENVGPGLLDWLQSLSAIEWGLLVLALGLAGLTAALVLVFYQLLRQNGAMMLRIEALEAKLGGRTEAAVPAGIAVNGEAPDFNLPGLDGIPVSLTALRQLGKSVLLVFTEPGCPACDELLPEVGAWQRRHEDRLLVVAISRGDQESNRAKAMRHGVQHLLLQVNREVADAYHVQGTPSAVLVGTDGRIASPLAAGAAAIRDLVFSATLPPPVTKGDPAPSLALHDLDESPFDPDAARGRSIVLLFWNPACGYCQAMLDDLRSWERTRARRAPELVIISTGSAETNREQRFRSRVLLDQTFGVSQVFGVAGTPSAVMLDEQGRVASDVVVGAPAVLAMLGARQGQHVSA
jgi:methylamine dehydrogenase accessory protein MauD